MSGLFNTGFRDLETALMARESLQLSHASNIANADTPNYLADRRTFEDVFAAEKTRLSSPGYRQYSVTDSGVLQASRIDPANASLRVDGNNIDPQTEMARMAENQLMHELTMRLIKGKIGSLANAIKEGR